MNNWRNFIPLTRGLQIQDTLLNPNHNMHVNNLFLLYFKTKNTSFLQVSFEKVWAIERVKKYSILEINLNILPV